MAQNLKNIDKIYSILKKNNLIESLTQRKPHPDEPHMYFYSIKLMNIQKLNSYNNWDGHASGFSFFSRKIALLKSLSEAAERLSNSSFQEKDLIYNTYEKIMTQKALSPNTFVYHKNINKVVFGWKEGFDFFTGKKVLLPAQTLYFTYPLNSEPKLGEMITTGAAGGFDTTSTILRAILEVIERDAFTTMYLTQFKPILINLNYLNDNKIQSIISQLSKYNLTLYLFDITSDLEVPCFMTILVDKTGLGPAVSAGLKSGFDSIDAIIGSIQEALLCRTGIKNEMIKRHYIHNRINPKNIHTLLQRGLYWAPLSSISRLSPLLNQKSIKKLYKKTNLSEKQSLEKLKSILKKRGKSVYLSNITHPIFLNSDYLVYKAVIPDLQPLYLQEKKRYIHKKRLNEYARFNKANTYSLNMVPHPFL